jgi:hypothetical protein
MARTVSLFFKASLVLVAGVLFNDDAQWGLIQLSRSLPLPMLITSLVNHWEKDIFHRWIATASIAPAHIIPISRITALDQMSKVDITRPFVVAGLSSNEVFSLEAMLSPPLSEMIIDYFADARLPVTVPDSRAPLGAVVRNITRGGPEKIGTQKITRAEPSIIRGLIEENSHWLTTVFTDARVNLWKRLGFYITIPVFMSRGMSSTLNATTRTDFHTEPIANLVFQTLGYKKWTLISPEHSRLLKPTVSPDGRAYFYSTLDPMDPSAFSNISRYEVVTNPGDALFIPCWTWHRVEYVTDVTAASVSIFEFNPREWIVNNPAFALTIIPNMIKELAGLKLQ